MTGERGSPATVVLLGPQRREPTADAVLRELAPEGPVALVAAGLREREDADADLQALLDGRAVNLGLHRRRVDAVERDPQLAALARRRRSVLEELAAAYRIRLEHAAAAVYELMRRDTEEQVRTAAVDDAISTLQAIDTRHLELVDEVEAELHDRWPLHERPVVTEHRDELEQILDGAAAVAVAGGHVDVLLDCLSLFDLGPSLDATPVLAWSAGAMAVTERVVLFHDRAPHGARYAEVHGRGLGLCRGAIALPHARERLDLDDQDRMAVLARRFAPDRCVLLDAGCRADVVSGEPIGAPTVTPAGAIDLREAA